MLRKPAVAGMFYDADPEELRETLDACFLGPYGPGKLPMAAPLITRDIVGLVSPHAGYRFSGFAAAYDYYALAEDGIPDTAIIIGPNHRGGGSPAAIQSEGVWQTPLGDVQIDSETARAVMSSSQLLQDDALPHVLEHSIEVQVPFLQYLSPSIKIVPILLSVLSWEDAVLFAEDIGHAVAKGVGDKNIVVIASTDFTHYEAKSIAEVQDSNAIAAIERLDHRGLLDVVEQKGISMCGVLPTAAAIVASSDLGAKRGELLSYYTSGDILGETSQVVGYGALKIVRDVP